MLKQTSSLAPTGLLLPPTLAAPYSQARARSKDTDPRLTEKVAATGTGARVSVRRRDKQKLTGYVAELGPREFVLTMARGGRRSASPTARPGKSGSATRSASRRWVKFLNVLGVLGILGAVGDGGG